MGGIEPARAKSMDITEKDAASIFSHIPVAKCTPAELWKYDSIGRFRLKPTWHLVMPWRACITDLVVATDGHQANQKCLADLLAQWIATNGIAGFNAKTIDHCALRLRTMVGQLRETKRLGRPVPKQFSMLNGILELMKVNVVTYESVGGEDEDDVAVLGIADKAASPPSARTVVSCSSTDNPLSPSKTLFSIPQVRNVGRRMPAIPRAALTDDRRLSDPGKHEMQSSGCASNENLSWSDE